MSSQAWVVLGKIVGAYGVRGWVRIHALADDPQSWGKLPLWWVGHDAPDAPEGLDWHSMPVRRSRIHLGALVAELEDITDRDAAEKLKGALIGIPREALPPAGKDEYYWDDLIGLEVVNARDVRLGKVVSLLETGANDVLCVHDDGGKELLLPFVGAVVLDVDIGLGRIRVEWEADW